MIRDTLLQLLLVLTSSSTSLLRKQRLFGLAMKLKLLKLIKGRKPLKKLRRPSLKRSLKRRLKRNPQRL